MLIPQAPLFYWWFLHKKLRFSLISRSNAPETCVRGSPHVLCQSRTEIVHSIKTHLISQKLASFSKKNMSCNMKMCVSSVSLFKICASIIYNLRKRARRAPYFRQRFHMFTQYVLCRYGRYCFSERCFCTNICDSQ